MGKIRQSRETPVSMTTGKSSLELKIQCAQKWVVGRDLAKHEIFSKCLHGQDRRVGRNGGFRDNRKIEFGAENSVWTKVGGWARLGQT